MSNGESSSCLFGEIPNHATFHVVLHDLDGILIVALSGFSPSCSFIEVDKEPYFQHVLPDLVKSPRDNANHLLQCMSDCVLSCNNSLME